MGIVRYVAKATFAGGIVYYTINQDLWSKSKDSILLYGKIYNNIIPYIKDSVPKEVLNELPPMPNTSVLFNSVKSSWNKGVIVSMKFLSETPTHLSSGVQNLTKLIQKYIEI